MEFKEGYVRLLMSAQFLGLHDKKDYPGTYAGMKEYGIMPRGIFLIMEMQFVDVLKAIPVTI